MNRKITPKSQAKITAGVRREREPVSWKYILLTGFCGLILVVGFFGAARQHFASIDYGIKNSKLRRQVDELKTEQRRLLLSKEVALSPGEVKKNARKIGFTEMTASNIQTFRSDAESLEKPNANKSEGNEPKSKDEGKSKTAKDKTLEKLDKKVETKEKVEPKKEVADRVTTRKRKL